MLKENLASGPGVQKDLFGHRLNYKGINYYSFNVFNY